MAGLMIRWNCRVDRQIGSTKAAEPPTARLAATKAAPPLAEEFWRVARSRTTVCCVCGSLDSAPRFPLRNLACCPMFFRNHLSDLAAGDQIPNAVSAAACIRAIRIFMGMDWRYGGRFLQPQQPALTTSV